MTMRSKQWYAKVSRLPNSLANSSIGPLPPCALELASRAWDRGPMVVKDSRLSDIRHLGAGAAHTLSPAQGGARKFQILLGRIREDPAWYSVPSRWARLSATAYIGVDDVRIVCMGESVTHPRARFGTRRMRYRHFPSWRACPRRCVRSRRS